MLLIIDNGGMLLIIEYDVMLLIIYTILIYTNNIVTKNNLPLHICY